MKEKDITDAYIKIRKIDNTIPDDVLDFMKNAAIEKIKAESFYGECSFWKDCEFKKYVKEKHLHKCNTEKDCIHKL